MRPYVPGEDLTGVSISDADKSNGSPKVGDMIARNPKNHEDKWLVSEKYFSENLVEADPTAGKSPDPLDESGVDLFISKDRGLRTTCVNMAAKSGCPPQHLVAIAEEIRRYIEFGDGEISTPVKDNNTDLAEVLTSLKWGRKAHEQNVLDYAISKLK